jgi:hypothetical protein
VRLLIGLWQKIVCVILMSGCAYFENILKSFDPKPD